MSTCPGCHGGRFVQYGPGASVVCWIDETLQISTRPPPSSPTVPGWSTSAGSGGCSRTARRAPCGSGSRLPQLRWGVRPRARAGLPGTRQPAPRHGDSPAHCWTEADAWDEDLVRVACDWLVTVAPAEGGRGLRRSRASGGLAARALVGARGGASRLARRDWPDRGLAARSRFEHPWLDGATEVMWNRIGKLGADMPGGIGGGYEDVRRARVLQHVPDRDRAREVFGRVGPLNSRPRDGGAGSGVIRGVARRCSLSPPSRTRSPGPCFDDATVGAHLDPPGPGPAG